ncbi:acetyl-CoA carboxylase biotin carboxyl carrier protein [Aminicella lysinilytica]|uniref:Biotin carboxyl carrier protein of acetyl-CoA carboxylase n=1 Tax=Aminicella lysinilytica TaxID=433323 RepID=A0A4R6Q8I2_9FIRM|nr:acetyl-CoA carboxylase biotin carboxyl carrier protein [Aminicella lysinilytica]TDP58440.1 acetyl-CoA carboxylase biotin carboxyl carrier protein [Aminicella lysinilytica]
MEKQEIYELMARFEKSELAVMEIEDDGGRVRFEKEQPCAKGSLAGLAGPATTASLANVPAIAAGNTARPAGAPAPITDPDLAPVKSPIVGIFYMSPAPDQEAFATEGQQVKKGQTLCLVEAMKMMNELKSPVDGVVEKVMADDGEMVQYDQVLFEVRPC